MAVEILAVVRRHPWRTRIEPTLRVRCDCGHVYYVRAYPSTIRRRRERCVRCAAREAMRRRREAFDRPGVPGMACSNDPDPLLADLSERELAWLGRRRGS